jgi:hypothetical protein
MMKSFEGKRYVPKDNKEFKVAISMLCTLGYPIYSKEECLGVGLGGWDSLIWCSGGFSRSHSESYSEDLIFGLENLASFIFTEEESVAQKELTKLQRKIDELQEQANILKEKI